MKQKHVFQDQSQKLAGALRVANAEELSLKEVENPKAAIPNPKSQKRDNTFSKSRDTREDRGSRKMKTTHSPQTFQHVP